MYRLWGYLGGVMMVAAYAGQSSLLPKLEARVVSDKIQVAPAVMMQGADQAEYKVHYQLTSLKQGKNNSETSQSGIAERVGGNFKTLTHLALSLPATGSSYRLHLLVWTDQGQRAEKSVIIEHDAQGVHVLDSE